MKPRFQFLFLWLALAAALAIPPTFGLERIDPGAILTAIVLAAGSLMAGQACSRLLRLPVLPGFTAAFETVIGYAVFAVLELLAAEAFRLGPIASTGLALAIAAGVWRWAGKRRGDEGRAERGAGIAWDAAALVVASLLAVLWSRQAIAAWRSVPVTHVYRADFDFMFHALQIQYLLHFPVYHGASLAAAGTPHSFYHMGSYAPAALFARNTGVHTLVVSTAFWLPVALIFLGMGAYGFGAALGGRAAGTAAGLALFLVPDASHYGVRDAFLNFYWLLEVSPGLGYGLGIILASLGVYIRGAVEGRFDLMVKAAAVSLVTAFFKVQLAIPATAVFTVLIFWDWKPARAWHRWAALGGLGAAAAAAALLFEKFPIAPHFLRGPYEFKRLFEVVDQEAGPPFQGLYDSWTAHASAGVKALLGAGMVLSGAFGLWIPAMVPFSFGRWRAPWPATVRLLPFLVLAVYLAGMFLIPVAGPPDSTEFSHRPFTLVYAVLVCCIAAAAAQAAGGMAARPGFPRAALAAALLIAVGGGLAGAVVNSRDVQTLRNYDDRTHHPIAPGYLAAVMFLRDRSALDDWFLASDGDPYGLTNGVAERPEFLSRMIDYARFPKSPFTDRLWSRFRLGAVLQRMQTYGQLRDFGKKYGIRWFLLQPTEMRLWPDAIRRHSVFDSGGYRVFDLTRN